VFIATYGSEDGADAALKDFRAMHREGSIELIDADITVIAECGDGEELLAAVDREAPDVVVTDIRMPPSDAETRASASRTTWSGGCRRTNATASSPELAPPIQRKPGTASTTRRASSKNDAWSSTASTRTSRRDERSSLSRSTGDITPPSSAPPRGLSILRACVIECGQHQLVARPRACAAAGVDSGCRGQPLAPRTFTARATTRITTT
jgi:CheY-like chemotaxis protein